MSKKQTAIKTRAVRHDDEKHIIALLKELTEKPINLLIKDIVNDNNCHAIVLENEDGKVVGFGALIVHIIPTKGYVGRVEEIVVAESFRGQGLGERLMDELIEIGKKRALVRIDLTSRPARVSAHKLYLRKGFFLRDTGVYRLSLE
jgi:ribosomal protein S18 acetylase RimI-like enzyme